MAKRHKVTRRTKRGWLGTGHGSYGTEAVADRGQRAWGHLSRRACGGKDALVRSTPSQLLHALTHTCFHALVHLLVTGLPIFTDVTRGRSFCHTHTHTHTRTHLELEHPAAQTERKRSLCCTRLLSHTDTHTHTHTHTHTDLVCSCWGGLCQQGSWCSQEWSW